MLGKKQMAWITQYRQKGIIFIVVPNERKIIELDFSKVRRVKGSRKIPHGKFPLGKFQSIKLSPMWILFRKTLTQKIPTWNIPTHFINSKVL